MCVFQVNAKSYRLLATADEKHHKKWERNACGAVTIQNQENNAIKVFIIDIYRPWTHASNGWNLAFNCDNNKNNSHKIRRTRNHKSVDNDVDRSTFFPQFTLHKNKQTFRAIVKFSLNVNRLVRFMCRPRQIFLFFFAAVPDFQHEYIFLWLSCSPILFCLYTTFPVREAKEKNRAHIRANLWK